MIQIPLFGAFQGGTSYAQNMGSRYAHKTWWFLVCATGLPKNQLQLMMQLHATGCSPVASKKGQKTRPDWTLKHYSSSATWQKIWGSGKVLNIWKKIWHQICWSEISEKFWYQKPFRNSELFRSSEFKSEFFRSSDLWSDYFQMSRFFVKLLMHAILIV